MASHGEHSARAQRSTGHWEPVSTAPAGTVSGKASLWRDMRRALLWGYQERRVLPISALPRLGEQAAAPELPWLRWEQAAQPCWLLHGRAWRLLGPAGGQRAPSPSCVGPSPAPSHSSTTAPKPSATDRAGQETSPEAVGQPCAFPTCHGQGLSEALAWDFPTECSDATSGTLEKETFPAARCCLPVWSASLIKHRAPSTLGTMPFPSSKAFFG